MEDKRSSDYLEIKEAFSSFDENHVYGKLLRCLSSAGTVITELVTDVDVPSFLPRYSWLSMFIDELTRGKHESVVEIENLDAFLPLEKSPEARSGSALLSSRRSGGLAVIHGSNDQRQDELDESKGLDIGLC